MNSRTLRWLLLALSVQLPTLAVVGRQFPIFIGLAALLTVGLFARFRTPFDVGSHNRLRLYGVIWPFFIWWATCLAFCLTAPVVGLLGGSLTHSLLVALLLGLGWTLSRPRITRHEIHIENLPDAFDGYRVAHVSDIHCGAFAPEGRVRRWARRVARLEPDLVAVTGDLIASGNHYIDAVARALSELRARDGVFAAMGNHDYFGDGERLVVALTENGISVLRNEGVLIDRAGAQLFVGGVDDTWTGRASVGAALRARPDGVVSMVLAHDPDLFAELSSRGVELTLSGHTHGGQLAVPGMARRFNLARFITPFTRGVYRRGKSVLYVNRGAGTTGPPLRIGSRAELTLITLRRAA